MYGQRDFGGDGKVSAEILNQIRGAEREAEESVARAREEARVRVERARSDSVQGIDAAHNAGTERIRAAAQTALSEVEKEVARRGEEMDRTCENLRARAEERMPEAIETIIERIMD